MKLKILNNKRYKDIFEKYIYKGEPTPLTIGTLIVVAFCFLILIIATFTQFNISHPWIGYIDGIGLNFMFKHTAYTPLIPAMIFIIYLLGRKYSTLLFILYTLIGFFVIPIFSFGNGYSNVQNYLFGYFLGFIFATFISGEVLNRNQDYKYRLIAGLLGVISIHICGFIYCLFLAIFRVIDFGFIFLVASVLSGGKIIYDIIFSSIIILIAPYIKNIFWICMKPKANRKEKRLARKYSYTTLDNQ